MAAFVRLALRLLTEKQDCSKTTKAGTRFCSRVRIRNVRIGPGCENVQTGPPVAARDKENMQIIETLENRKDAVKVSELARLLSVTPKHIYKTRAAGRIPGAFRVNRALRFDPQILAEWLKRELMPDVAASRGKQKRTR